MQSRGYFGHKMCDLSLILKDITSCKWERNILRFMSATAAIVDLLRVENNMDMALCDSASIVEFVWYIMYDNVTCMVLYDMYIVWIVTSLCCSKR